jgi:uncharacterized protein YjbI with pentapeptide repeats
MLGQELGNTRVIGRGVRAGMGFVKPETMPVQVPESSPSMSTAAPPSRAPGNTGSGHTSARRSAAQLGQEGAMDRDRFDALTRLCAASSSRRGTLAALLGAGLAGVAGGTDARKRRGQRSRNGRVAAQAVDCANLASGQDVSGCDYTGEDHSRENLSSARMVGAIFRDALLVGTNLNSASMQRAVFRGAKLTGANLASGVLEGASLRDADLCGANLRSAVVRGATFRDANLTKANLKSATGCGSATFTAGTTFCGTRMCDGSIRSDDCPGTPAADICCADADCGPNRFCDGGACAACTVCLTPGACAFTSLAAAVAATGGPTTIHICPGAYVTQSVELDKDLTIVGAGGGDGGTILDRVSPTGGDVLNVSANVTVEIRNLAVIRGFSGIINRGTLTLRGVTVRNNHAFDGAGGGISNSGTLTLANGTRVVSNIARFIGGGILNNGGTVTMKSGSRVETNTTGIGNGGGGGGIFSDGGTVTLEAGSRVTGNTAGGDGGGIFEEGGEVNVADATIVTANTPNNCRPAGAVPNCDN